MFKWSKLIKTTDFFVFIFVILFPSVSYADTYREMDFGYDGCNVHFGRLYKGISKAEMIRLATISNANGFTYHSELRYGKIMIGDYPIGCKSPANMSWPLYLRSSDASDQPVMSANPCINSLKKIGLWPPPKEVEGRVRDYCTKGDFRSAVIAIREATLRSQSMRDLIDQPFLMAIEDVFSITGKGTVVTGQIIRGKIKVGETIEIIAHKNIRSTIVIGVEMFQRSVEEGKAGDKVGLILRGIDRVDIERGMILAKPGSI